MVLFWLGCVLSCVVVVYECFYDDCVVVVRCVGLIRVASCCVFIVLLLSCVSLCSVVFRCVALRVLCFVRCRMLVCCLRLHFVIQYAVLVRFALHCFIVELRCCPYVCVCVCVLCVVRCPSFVFVCIVVSGVVLGLSFRVWVVALI